MAAAQQKAIPGYDFDRQKIIGDFIVDFFCLNCNVVIEVDGGSHRVRREYDTEREAFLTGLGLTVIHIPAEDVLHRLDQVMDRLYRHPALLPVSVYRKNPSLAITRLQKIPLRGGVARRSDGADCAGVVKL